MIKKTRQKLVARFKIDLEYPDVNLKVKVYPNLKQLRAATKNTDVYGMFSSYTVTDVLTDVSRFEGTIHLDLGHCGGGVVSHEATHAALAIYLYLHGNVFFEPDDKEREEVLAYLVGDIVSKTYDYLYGNKVIEE